MSMSCRRVLEVASVLMSWFGAPFCRDDGVAFGLAFGASECQQVVEALAVTFGIRAWRSSWVTARKEVRQCVCSDLRC